VLGSPGAVTSVTAGPDGELYVTSLNPGAVFRITNT
jgi:hypothetical protein